MKRIALAIVAILALSSTAHAQKRVRHRYVQQTDPYAKLFNDWASGQTTDFRGISTCATIGGSGSVFGSSISCNVCGTDGHYTCGAGASSCPTNYLYQSLRP
jgi:hypothetical protein